MTLRPRLLWLAALAAAFCATLVVGLAGAAKPPASAKAWLGVWKAKWGYVVFDTMKYSPPHSPQDFVWGTQGTWVYHGIHRLFGGVGPRSGGHANQTFGGVWFMDEGTSNSPLGSFLIFRSLEKFTGGYWKTCDYYCTSHHPWRGKHVGSCRKGCKVRKLKFSFSQRGRPDRAPQYIEYSREKGGGTVKIPVNRRIKPERGMAFLGVEGKARGSATHLHTEHLSVDSFKKVRYRMQAGKGASYAKYKNGVQELIVPIAVSGGPPGLKTCKKSPGMLKLTDGGRDAKKDRLVLYVGGGGISGFCGDPETFRYSPPKPNGQGFHLKVKISRR